MKNKISKAKLFTNTVLMLILAIIFGAMSFYNYRILKENNEQFIPMTVAPGICKENFKEDHGSWTDDGGYVCSANSDESHEKKQDAVSDPNQLAVFLYNTSEYNDYVLSTQINRVYAVISAMATLGCLFGAVIYFNHNR